MRSIELFNIDCMKYMQGLENNAFNLAIVDPPYSWNSGNDFTSRLKRYGDLSFNESRPSSEYFSELKRVSEHQIIWGGNYFLSDLDDTKCLIIWDKHQPVKTYARLEIAWTSFSDRHCEYIDLAYFGAHGSDVSREHPNQKPIQLYEKLLSLYAKEGDRILDTHLGSGSSAIAAHYGDFDFVGCEIDKIYYDSACKRFDAETAQQAMNL